jgi:AraC family L-rhamnose operon regulatory protein RhaS
MKLNGPSMAIISEEDVSEYKTLKKGSNTVLYFKPSVVRDEFTIEDLNSGKFEETMGMTVYQDYLLIRDFFAIKEPEKKIFNLSLNEFNKVKGLIESIEKELTMQHDGFWPCRSRSYLMELLFFTEFLWQAFEGNKGILSEDDTTFSLITEYLNEHFSDEISLESLTKKFNINRNKLNSIFLYNTSKTCLNYLMDLRIDMAKIILSNTGIPISEVAGRVGYSDSNYFTKIFKKQTGFTPSAYRISNLTCR